MNNENKEVGFLDDFAGEGTHNFSGDDFQIPFLKILQPQSAKLLKNSDEYIEGAEAGMFYNSISNKVYGNELNLIVMKYERKWLEFKPARGGFVASHEPDTITVDKSNYSNWTTPEGNTITETYNYFVSFADMPDEGVLVFSLSGSSIRHAKNWNTLLAGSKLPSRKQAPIFANVWNVKTIYNQNEKGQWYAPGAKTSAIKSMGLIKKDLFVSLVEPAKKLLESNTAKYEALEDPKITTEQDLLNETKY